MHLPLFFLVSAIITLPGVISVIRLLSDGNHQTVSTKTQPSICQLEHTCPIAENARQLSERLRSLKTTLQITSMHRVPAVTLWQ
jgi:hypothetical protein